jgi:hypothetical protein
MASGENALDVLRDMLRERMNVLSDATTNGSCDDFSSYRYNCGTIRGLAEAESMLLDLKERIEEN